MNLKKFIFKTVAVFAVVSLLVGNCSLFGIGLSKVIAENLKAPEIEINLENEKYVNYQVGNYSGVAIQSKLEINTNQLKDTYMPTENANIDIALPKLNGYTPERASVVKASTQASTGEKENWNINQNYNKDSGLLNVSYKNDSYSEYKENAKDEFEIIYIYPAEAYEQENKEVTLNYSVNANITFKYAQGTVSSQKHKNISLKEKDNKADLTTMDITELKNDIYKGYLYTNTENNTKYNTEFNSIATLSVLNKNLTDEINANLEESKFINGEGKEISTNGKIVYKSTSINKNEFNKIFGQEGNLEIYNNEELLATVKYVDVLENKNTVKKLAVVYSENDVRVSADEDEILLVEYGENVTQLKIKTSKPVAEGYINFENKNTIIAANNYGVEAKDLKYVSTNTIIESTKTETIDSKENTIKINKYEANSKMELKEPETKISVASSNINFSTLQTSKTKLTVKLDDTNSSAKLFNNPTIKIILPKGLTSGNLSSPAILNGNGLKIKSAKANNNIITIELEGKQTSYDINNVSGGVSIVMDIDNLGFNNITPSHTDKIEVSCIQGKEEVRTSQNVNIVSKAGLLLLSKVSGYSSNTDITTTIDSNVKQIEISENDEAKGINQTISLVNNFDKELTNVQIIGRIGYSDNKVVSTFNAGLTDKIEVENAKVYYSENKDAGYNDNSWKEEFNTNAKAYKIVLNEKLAKATAVVAKINTKLPEKLGYNQSTYIKTETSYKYDGKDKNEISVIGFNTKKDVLSTNTIKAEQNLATLNGEKANVNVYVTPTITQNYVHGGQLVIYKLKVENNSNEDLKDIVLEDLIPENAIYTYKEEKEGSIANYYEQKTDSTIRKKIINISTLKANKTKEYEIMLTMADVDKEQEIINKVNLKYNNQTISAESKLTLKPAAITTTLTTREEEWINPTYNSSEIVEYYIKIKNTSSNKIENAKVQYQIPQYLEYKEGGLGLYDKFEGYSIKEQGTINNNIFEYTVKNLKADEEETIVVRCQVNQLNGVYETNVNSIANVYIGDDIYQTNSKNIQILQSAYEISMQSNVKETDILKKDNEITYTIKVKNIGKRSGAFNVQDNIPEQIEVSKIEYGKDEEKLTTLTTSKQNIDLTNTLNPDETLIVKITGKVKEIIQEKDSIIEVNNFATIVIGDYKLESNKVLIKIKPEVKNIEEDPSNPVTPTDPTDPSNPNEPTQPDNPGGTEEQKVHTISGVAWLDSNKNGKRDTDEKLLESVVVTLFNKQTGNVVTNESGNKITATTDSNGQYKFENIKEGNYLIIFEFDTNKYTVTTYQKEGVEETANSDAIISNVSINGQTKLAAISDNINLNSNKENIDIGLIENATFDLSLNKQITKATVTNKQGTQEFTYKDGDTAKVDLVAKYINGAVVIVNYKFTITNNGDTVGYVNSLVDNLPSGLEFSSELNKDWYKGNDGRLYTTSLSGIAIKPGETSEVELILTKTMTENNTGVFTNNAELEKISNLENIQEKDEAKENNKSSAILVLSIKTGSVILYTGITLVCIAIMAAGAYIIKKKILDKEI